MERVLQQGVSHSTSAHPLGPLRRTEPLDPYFGFGRGTPVDRLYIDGFLAEQRAAIRGRVLEFGDDRYGRRFGQGEDLRLEILYPRAAPGAHHVADLNGGGALPEDAFDCILCVQTLQFIRDPETAVRTLAGALRPGGTLLVTVPCISQRDRHEARLWGEYWRYTAQGLQALLARVFPAEHVSTRGRGNVLAATALLQGVALEELDREELDRDDPCYEVTVLGRATRPGPPSAAAAG